MIRKHIWWRFVAMALSLSLVLGGCMSNTETNQRDQSWVPSDDVPKLPEKLSIDQATGVPELAVYNAKVESISRMDIESYVAGVVAGEMKNDWPEEALKAQAILARTFVLKFCNDKKSKYKGADISTDVSEAQAYDADSVNDRVRSAVSETRGLVMEWKGEYPNAWFHAHSGGMTELPSVALDYKDGDPDYLEPVKSSESGKAPDSVKHWNAEFTSDEVAAACRDAGLNVDHVETIEIGEKGTSGRAKTLLVNGNAVSAPSFRIQIDPAKLKSTLIESVRLSEGKVTFRGRGFGHGVGMSQWGAYEMAEQGKDALQIIRHYFSDVGIVRLW